ncbi:MAG: glycosyltransferase family 4 protein [Chloroflexota bacterium]|nr:glycosyltransferase family 4 protein [Chloroflexota bacterium]
MKILYCALAIDISGSHGGATHVREVTNGLAALGHEVRVIVRGTAAHRPRARLHARVTRLTAPPKLAWTATPRVRKIVSEWQPDIVIERFYTFAGGGMLAAHARAIPAILEVNAPVFDPPGTAKDRMDRCIGSAMRRWATQQCRWADAIVTPLATTVPATVREKVIPLQWGANVRHFDPARFPQTGVAAYTLRRRYDIPPDAPVVGFIGSFRTWHGAAEAIRAFHRVRAQIPNASLLLVGDGPERQTLERAVRDASQPGIVFTGAVPYHDVPLHLALCDVAVAPFVPSLHAPLRSFGFYWSPLKVFEAMAMAVPVVTTAVAPLTAIVRGAGIVVPERDTDALASAIVDLLGDPERRVTMGAIGRARVVAEWSWEAHCRHLDTLITTLVMRQ